MTKRFGKMTKAEYEEQYKQFFRSPKEEYLRWCSENNLPPHIRKSPATFRRELELLRKQQADYKLYESNKSVNTRSVLKLLMEGEKAPYGAIYNVLSTMFAKTHLEKSELHRRLDHLERNSKLLDDVDTLNMVKNLFEYDVYWLHDITEWKPKSHNKPRQFASLVRFLLAKYDVPAFMDQAWQDDAKEVYREWFIHIGNGGNMRKARHLNMSMTKKMAHHFLRTPADYTIPDAFVYGHVYALGGDESLVRAVLHTRLFENNGDITFRESVLKLFIDNPMLDRAQVGPIIDYIWAQKYQTTPVYRAGLVIRNEPPPQPNFSMNGRTPETLMAQVQRWHRQLGKEKRSPKATWIHSKYNDFEMKEGAEKGHNVRIWRIAELCSASLLASEGRAMKHCVASYSYSCASGRSSIWSLSVQNKGKVERCLTIEVSGGAIRQARGKINRRPTDKEFGIMQRWATREGLTISRWLTPGG